MNSPTESAAVHDTAGETSEDQSCPACDCKSFVRLFSSTDWTYRTTDREFQTIECRRCRLIRLYPRPEPQELAKYYPTGYWFEADGRFAGQLRQAYRRFVLWDHVRFVKRAIAASGEAGIVLDVGCGGGFFLRALADGGAAVAGLDSSLDAARMAWQSQGVPAMCASLLHAPVAPGCCAVVTMFHVLEHLYNPRGCIEQARELLRPNGRLIVQVPNAASWQFLLLGGNWRGVEVPRHLTLFRPHDLEVLLDSCGFEVARTKHFSLRDNPPLLATSLAPGLDPLLRCGRGTHEGAFVRLIKDLLFFCLVVASAPFTVLEAACGAGATIMVEARKKA